MLYAQSPGTQELIPAVKGSVAVCPDCNAEMIPKCGSMVCHHWAHKSVSDCDTKYYDGMSEWHMNWQHQITNPIPGVNIEVPVVTEERYKRADLKPSHGVIIEFQKSPLPFEERRTRERHYKKMIWVVHKDIRSSKTWVQLLQITNKVPYQRTTSTTIRLDTPVIFDLGNNQLQCRIKDSTIIISKPHFVKTFINSPMYNDEIWNKIKERSERRATKVCDICFSRMKIYTDKYGRPIKHHYTEFCDNMGCLESKITVMFRHHNTLEKFWETTAKEEQFIAIKERLNQFFADPETIARKEQEEKKKEEKKNRFFTDPETLQMLYRVKEAAMQQTERWENLGLASRRNTLQFIYQREDEELLQKELEEINNNWLQSLKDGLVKKGYAMIPLVSTT